MAFASTGRKEKPGLERKASSTSNEKGEISDYLNKTVSRIKDKRRENEGAKKILLEKEKGDDMDVRKQWRTGMKARTGDTVTKQVDEMFLKNTIEKNPGLLVKMKLEEVQSNQRSDFKQSLSTLLGTIESETVLEEEEFGQARPMVPKAFLETERVFGVADSLIQKHKALTGYYDNRSPSCTAADVFRWRNLSYGISVHKKTTGQDADAIAQSLSNLEKKLIDDLGDISINYESKEGSQSTSNNVVGVMNHFSSKYIPKRVVKSVGLMAKILNQESRLAAHQDGASSAAAAAAAAAVTADHMSTRGADSDLFGTISISNKGEASIASGGIANVSSAVGGPQSSDDKQDTGATSGPGGGSGAAQKKKSNGFFSCLTNSVFIVGPSREEIYDSYAVANRKQQHKMSQPEKDAAFASSGGVAASNQDVSVVMPTVLFHTSEADDPGEMQELLPMYCFPSNVEVSVTDNFSASTAKAQAKLLTRKRSMSLVSPMPLPGGLAGATAASLAKQKKSVFFPSDFSINASSTSNTNNNNNNNGGGGMNSESNTPINSALEQANNSLTPENGSTVPALAASSKKLSDKKHKPAQLHSITRSQYVLQFGDQSYQNYGVCLRFPVTFHDIKNEITIKTAYVICLMTPFSMFTYLYNVLEHFEHISKGLSFTEPLHAYDKNSPLHNDLKLLKQFATRITTFSLPLYPYIIPNRKLSSNTKSAAAAAAVAATSRAIEQQQHQLQKGGSFFNNRPANERAGSFEDIVALIADFEFSFSSSVVASFSAATATSRSSPGVVTKQHHFKVPYQRSAYQPYYSQFFNTYADEKHRKSVMSLLDAQAANAPLSSLLAQQKAEREQENSFMVLTWALPVLLKHFPLDQIALVLGCMLSEMKIIVKHKDVHVTSAIIFALLQLISPMKWCYPVVVTVPDSLIDLLESPVPLLVGVQKLPNHFVQQEGFVVVDPFARTIILHPLDVVYSHYLILPHYSKLTNALRKHAETISQLHRRKKVMKRSVIQQQYAAAAATNAGAAKAAAATTAAAASVAVLNSSDTGTDAKADGSNNNNNIMSAISAETVGGKAAEGNAPASTAAAVNVESVAAAAKAAAGPGEISIETNVPRFATATLSTANRGITRRHSLLNRAMSQKRLSLTTSGDANSSVVTATAVAAATTVDNTLKPVSTPNASGGMASSSNEHDSSVKTPTGATMQPLLASPMPLELDVTNNDHQEMMAAIRAFKTLVYNHIEAVANTAIQKQYETRQSDRQKRRMLHGGNQLLQRSESGKFQQPNSQLLRANSHRKASSSSKQGMTTSPRATVATVSASNLPFAPATATSASANAPLLPAAATSGSTAARPLPPVETGNNAAVIMPSSPLPIMSASSGLNSAKPSPSSAELNMFLQQQQQQAAGNDNVGKRAQDIIDEAATAGEANAMQLPVVPVATAEVFGERPSSGDILADRSAFIAPVIERTTSISAVSDITHTDRGGNSVRYDPQSNTSDNAVINARGTAAPSINGTESDNGSSKGGGGGGSSDKDDSLSVSSDASSLPSVPLNARIMLASQIGESGVKFINCMLETQMFNNYCQVRKAAAVSLEVAVEKSAAAKAVVQFADENAKGTDDGGSRSATPNLTDPPTGGGHVTPKSTDVAAAQETTNAGGTRGQSPRPIIRHGSGSDFVEHAGSETFTNASLKAGRVDAMLGLLSSKVEDDLDDVTQELDAIVSLFDVMLTGSDVMDISQLNAEREKYCELYDGCSVPVAAEILKYSEQEKRRQERRLKHGAKRARRKQGKPSSGKTSSAQESSAKNNSYLQTYNECLNSFEFSQQKPVHDSQEKAGNSPLVWCNGLLCFGYANTAYCTSICMNLWERKVRNLRQLAVFQDIVAKNHHSAVVLKTHKIKVPDALIVGRKDPVFANLSLRPRIAAIRHGRETESQYLQRQAIVAQQMTRQNERLRSIGEGGGSVLSTPTRRGAAVRSVNEARFGSNGGAKRRRPSTVLGPLSYHRGAERVHKCSLQATKKLKKMAYASRESSDPATMAIARYYAEREGRLVKKGFKKALQVLSRFLIRYVWFFRKVTFIDSIIFVQAQIRGFLVRNTIPELVDYLINRKFERLMAIIRIRRYVRNHSKEIRQKRAHMKYTEIRRKRAAMKALTVKTSIPSMHYSPRTLSTQNLTTHNIMTSQSAKHATPRDTALGIAGIAATGSAVDKSEPSVSETQSMPVGPPAVPPIFLASISRDGDTGFSPVPPPRGSGDLRKTMMITSKSERLSPRNRQSMPGGRDLDAVTDPDSKGGGRDTPANSGDTKSPSRRSGANSPSVASRMLEKASKVFSSEKTSTPKSTNRTSSSGAAHSNETRDSEGGYLVPDSAASDVGDTRRSSLSVPQPPRVPHLSKTSSVESMGSSAYSGKETPRHSISERVGDFLQFGGILRRSSASSNSAGGGGGGSERLSSKRISESDEKKMRASFSVGFLPGSKKNKKSKDKDQEFSDTASSVADETASIQDDDIGGSVIDSDKPAKKGFLGLKFLKRRESNVTTASKSSKGSTNGAEKQSAAYNPGNNTPRSAVSDVYENMSQIDGEGSNSSQLGGTSTGPGSGHNRRQSTGTVSSLESGGIIDQHSGPPSPANKLSPAAVGGEARDLLLYDVARDLRESPSEFVDLKHSARRSPVASSEASYTADGAQQSSNLQEPLLQSIPEATEINTPMGKFMSSVSTPINRSNPSTPLMAPATTDVSLNIGSGSDSRDNIFNSTPKKDEQQIDKTLPAAVDFEFGSPFAADPTITYESGSSSEEELIEAAAALGDDEEDDMPFGGSRPRTLSQEDDAAITAAAINATKKRMSLSIYSTRSVRSSSSQPQTKAATATATATVTTKRSSPSKSTNSSPAAVAAATALSAPSLSPKDSQEKYLSSHGMVKLKQGLDANDNSSPSHTTSRVLSREESALPATGSHRNRLSTHSKSDSQITALAPAKHNRNPTSASDGMLSNFTASSDSGSKSPRHNRGYLSFGGGSSVDKDTATTTVGTTVQSEEVFDLQRRVSDENATNLGEDDIYDATTIKSNTSASGVGVVRSSPPSSTYLASTTVDDNSSEKERMSPKAAPLSAKAPPVKKRYPIGRYAQRNNYTISAVGEGHHHQPAGLSSSSSHSARSPPNSTGINVATAASVPVSASRGRVLPPRTGSGATLGVTSSTRNTPDTDEYGGILMPNISSRSDESGRPNTSVGAYNKNKDSRASSESLLGDKSWRTDSLNASVSLKGKKSVAAFSIDSSLEFSTDVLDSEKESNGKLLLDSLNGSSSSIEIHSTKTGPPFQTNNIINDSALNTKSLDSWIEKTSVDLAGGHVNKSNMDGMEPETSEDWYSKSTGKFGNGAVSNRSQLTPLNRDDSITSDPSHRSDVFEAMSASSTSETNKMDDENIRLASTAAAAASSKEAVLLLRKPSMAPEFSPMREIDDYDDDEDSDSDEEYGEEDSDEDDEHDGDRAEPGSRAMTGGYRNRGEVHIREEFNKKVLATSSTYEYAKDKLTPQQLSIIANMWYLLSTSGVDILKHGRNGRPKDKLLFCNQRLTKLYWRSPGSTADPEMDYSDDDYSNNNNNDKNNGEGGGRVGAGSRLQDGHQQSSDANNKQQQPQHLSQLQLQQMQYAYPRSQLLPGKSHHSRRSSAGSITNRFVGAKSDFDRVILIKDIREVRENLTTDVMKRSLAKHYVSESQQTAVISIITEDELKTTLDFEIDEDVWGAVYHALQILINFYRNMLPELKRESDAANKKTNPFLSTKTRSAQQLLSGAVGSVAVDQEAAEAARASPLGTLNGRRTQAQAQAQEPYQQQHSNAAPLPRSSTKSPSAGVVTAGNAASPVPEQQQQQQQEQQQHHLDRHMSGDGSNYFALNTEIMSNSSLYKGSRRSKQHQSARENRRQTYAGGSSSSSLL